MRLVRTVGLLILSLHVAAAGSAGRQATSPQSRDLVSAFLVDRMGFDQRDLAAIEAGRAVARTLDGRTPVDIAVVGAVRIRATPTSLVARLRDIVSFEKSASVLQIGTFGATPAPGDLARLTLDPGDLNALRTCTPADCDLQLPAEAMNTFRTSVDWRAADAASAGARLMRQFLVDLVLAYRQSGNEALGRYDDVDPPTHVAEEFRLLGFARDMPVALPALASHLTDYPRSALRSAEEFYYWSKVEFGLKPTIRLNHVTIHPVTDRRDGLRYVVATKQLYASHYFSTALELRFLIEDPARPGQGFVLLLVTKSRVPGFSGAMGRMIRLVVAGRAAGSMQRHLEHTKTLTEGPKGSYLDLWKTQGTTILKVP